MEGQRENHQILTTRLYDAALEGDIPALINLFQEDPLILDRWKLNKSSGQYMQSPLHVAANLGHLEFTKEILRHKPELVMELDNSQKWTALHLSSEKGHLDIVRALLAVSHDMCLTRDIDGRNPVHIAAIRGQNHVLCELVRAKPQAAQERTNYGENVFHLCVKHAQIETLKLLVNITDDGQLLNSKDREGNTVLQLAVMNKQPEMVKFLLKDKRMGRNIINANGLTAMDTHIQSRKDLADAEIWRLLKRAKVLRAKDALRPRNRHRNWLESKQNSLMVVASLIATMAFQVGVNPPGGAWQDNVGHEAGSSIMADIDKDRYESLLLFNTISLVSSLSVIFLLISGLPCKRLFVGILTITMWIAVSATTLTYIVAVNFMSSSQKHHAVVLTLRVSLIAWLGLMILLLLGHAIRLIVKLLKQLARSVIKICGRFIQ